jgi:N-acetylneuraminic acid mutarotase
MRRNMPFNRGAAIAVAVASTMVGCDRIDSSNPTAPEIELATTAVTSNSWATKASMPTARAPKAGTINSIIYAVGGSSGQVEAYNVATNTWTTKKPYPGPGDGINGATPINGKLYVTSGNALYVYNPAANSWARKANLPRFVFSGVQATIGGRLYVYACGGDPCSHVFFRYNPSTNLWAARKVPPSVHREAAVGVINGKLYLAGGSDQQFGINRAMEVYDPATNMWKSGPRMLDARTSAASAVVNGKLYVAGGSDAGGAPWVDRLTVFNPTTNAWVEKAPMPAEGRRAGAAAANGFLFVMGGTDGSGMATARVFSYKP